MKPSAEHNMYYIAIVCPKGLNDKVLAFKKYMKEHYACVVALKSPAHITLIPPFWFAEEKEAELLLATTSFAITPGGVEVQLDGFSHFTNKILLVAVQVTTALEQLKNRAEDHFIESLEGAIEKQTRPFHPHITIANRDLKPSDFVKAWEYFSTKKFTETFRAQQISLLKLGPGKWNVICTST